MRSTASIMHLDLDAFFAAVEQRDKPSLRGKPVIVGGLGLRGVVSTASYEARVFGVHSAMPMHEARRLCPHAAFLVGRFGAYKAASSQVMGVLREVSPLVEPLSLDEAFVDVAAGEGHDLSNDGLRALAARVRAEVTERTGGLTASVGLGSSKFMAKVATEMGKPDGVFLVEPGTEVDVIAGLPARAIPGVGPATMEKLARLNVRTIADLRTLSERELVHELGRAAGEGLWALAFAQDDREVIAERQVKSISMEDTFEHNVTDRAEIGRLIEADAVQVAERLAKARLFARTITVKVRLPDFTTYTRSQTLHGATDRVEVIARVARELVFGLDLREGVRLLGVGVASFTEVAQEELFEPDEGRAIVETVQQTATDEGPTATPVVGRRGRRGYMPGLDVMHTEYGQGWVWGAGVGRVTVRFETADTPLGPVRTFAEDDEDLSLL